MVRILLAEREQMAHTLARLYQALQAGPSVRFLPGLDERVNIFGERGHI